MPDGGDEQNRRINGDNAPNATDSPKGREFQSEKIEEQAKAPTEGFYSRLIKEDNIPDKKIDDRNTNIETPDSGEDFDLGSFIKKILMWKTAANKG